MHANITLSKLISDKKNSRRVKPEREAHKRLVASIRAFGLLEPLIVRPAANDRDEYQVVAGERRLAALREIHRKDKGDPKIACQVRKVDDPTAEAMSLSENFAREAMHPLDEAEAFAKLASLEGKGAEVIAIEFGVTAHYVRQRMKLATLGDTMKTAYRSSVINTSIAEAFTAVPRDRQEEIWNELDGHPRHAEQVRAVIASAWIDASHAVFDVSALPEGSVSGDLFNQRMLVERAAFLEAQTNALQAQRDAMVEEGWSQAVVARREDVQDKLFSMVKPEQEFDAKTTRRLEKIQVIREKLESALEVTGDETSPALTKLQEKFDKLEAREQEIIEKAPEHFSEATKAVATVFLVVGPDGTVRREYRVPRSPRLSARNGVSNGDVIERPVEAPPLTCHDLSDKQLATIFHQQALSVRSALLDNAAARKRVLVLLLHDKVQSEALAIHADANGTTLHAARTEGFSSPAFNRLNEKRSALDPFADKHCMSDLDAYRQLRELSDPQVNALIGILTVETLTAHPFERLDLVQELASELKVDLREAWRPDDAWLSSFQKIQLTHLIEELKGSVYRPADERRKKSELVDALAGMFSEAVAGNIVDSTLATRLNHWLPNILMDEKSSEIHLKPG